jgi:uncharacterized membrane protein
MIEILIFIYLVWIAIVWYYLLWEWYRDIFKKKLLKTVKTKILVTFFAIWLITFWPYVLIHTLYLKYKD